MNNRVKVLCNPTQSLLDRRKIFGGFFVSFAYDFCAF